VTIVTRMNTTNITTVFKLLRNTHLFWGLLFTVQCCSHCFCPTIVALPQVRNHTWDTLTYSILAVTTDYILRQCG